VGDPALPPVGDPALPPVGDPPLPPVGDPALPPVGDPPLPPVSDPAAPPLAEPALPDVPPVLPLPKFLSSSPQPDIHDAAATSATTTGSGPMRREWCKRDILMLLGCDPKTARAR
jgi:hypothetical protein